MMYGTIRILLLLNFSYETKYKAATLFTKKEGARIGSNLFKAKWGVVPVKLAALNFLCETFSSKFLRSHSFDNMATLLKVSKESNDICQQNICSEKFRNSSSQMLYKIGLLKNFKEFSGKQQCCSHFLMQLQP